MSEGYGFIRNCIVSAIDPDSKIFIGGSTTIEGGLIASTEGKLIYIGKDCMISDKCEIRNGDSHAIYNNDGERINTASSIILQNHVWLGSNVKVLKGSVIPSGCVIGNSSIVTKKLDEPNSIYVGFPCNTFVRKNVTWTRER